MVSRRKSGFGHFAAKQESIVMFSNNHLTFAIQKCYNDGNIDVLTDKVVRISKIIAVRVICFFGAKLDNAAVERLCCSGKFASIHIIIALSLRR